MLEHAASLSELTYGLHVALRLGYIDGAEHARLDEAARMVAGPLYGLIRAQRRQLTVKAATCVGFLMMLTGSILT